MTAVLIQASPDSKIGFECFGAAREFWRYKGPEAVLAGPYETGKTMGVLYKLHCLMAKYDHCRALMVRKTYNSLVNSVVVSYEKKVLPFPPGHSECPVKKFGGEKPEFYDYPNESRIVLGGMDNPDKFLSAEFDFIYVNQLEELLLNDYELLTGRNTGRAANAPYTQLMADCNPSYPKHWILDRDRLKKFFSRHEDNPTLFDQTTHELTERGKKTIETLDALTGVRYKRGRQGLWAGVEGQVYEEWDDGIHLIDHFDPPAEWPRYRAIDFGYTNPFVCQWWAVDPDGRLYLYREIYMTTRLVQDHASEILRYEARLSVSEWAELATQHPNFSDLISTRRKLARQHERIVATVTDHDAEDRATLERHGIDTTPANKSIKQGIEAVQARLRIQNDGRPRLFIMRDSLVEKDERLVEKHLPLCTHDEVLMYVWPSAPDGRPVKEVPVDLNNHGMDSKRYIVAHLDLSSGAAVYRGSKRIA
jgi:phage terminase large subunit